MRLQEKEHSLGLNCSSLVISFILKRRGQMSLPGQRFLKPFYFPFQFMLKLHHSGQINVWVTQLGQCQVYSPGY